MTIFKKVERLNFTQEDFITCNANNVSIDAFINEMISKKVSWSRNVKEPSITIS